MHALTQPVSSSTATSTADQIAQAKEMDTPVKFRGGNVRYMAIFDTVNCSASVRLHMPAHSSGASHAVTRNVQNLRRTLLRCNVDDALQAGGTSSH
jgi:hypothetical protein